MISLTTKKLSHALKEWAVAVDALTVGKTILLLRKGGIREANGKFEVQHRQVWLYPTYEHQKPHLLKPEYTADVRVVESGWHPETVCLKSYAEITKILAIRDRNIISALQPYHIWNEQMISDRLKWKPQQPVFALLLRVYRLPQPQIIPYNNAYGGCKSWLDLVESISLDGLTPVLDDASYQQQVTEIMDIVGG
ncbi:MAG: DUF1802 family protein [Pleurocapsa sp.]